MNILLFGKNKAKVAGTDADYFNIRGNEANVSLPLLLYKLLSLYCFTDRVW